MTPSVDTDTMLAVADEFIAAPTVGRSRPMRNLRPFIPVAWKLHQARGLSGGQVADWLIGMEWIEPDEKERVGGYFRNVFYEKRGKGRADLLNFIQSKVVPDLSEDTAEELSTLLKEAGVK